MTKKWVNLIKVIKAIITQSNENKAMVLYTKTTYSKKLKALQIIRIVMKWVLVLKEGKPTTIWWLTRHSKTLALKYNRVH